MADQVFDFSQAGVEAEDVIVRSHDGEGRWVDVLVTASGRRALWNKSEGWSFEEALAWLAAVGG
jgi:hypothetical protein